MCGCFISGNLIVICSNWKKESDKACRTTGVGIILEDSVKPQNDIEMINRQTEASEEHRNPKLQSDFTSTTTNCVDSSV